MKTLLFLRGDPGSGKHTVGRILAADLGWRLFWLHALDPVLKIVGGRPLDADVAELMQNLSETILMHLMEKEEDIIYIRPDRTGAATEELRSAIKAWPNYRFVPVRLTASYETLVRRVHGRTSPEGTDRCDSAARLDEYQAARPFGEVEGEFLVNTDLLTPQQAAEAIKYGLGLAEPPALKDVWDAVRKEEGWPTPAKA